MSESRLKTSGAQRPAPRRRGGPGAQRGRGRLRGWCWLALLLLLGTLGAAAAGPAELEATDSTCLRDSECMSHYQNARQLSKAGQSQAALAEYQRAYQHEPVPRLLYSIARLQHRLGQNRDALVSYQRFLATASAGDEELRSKAQEYKTQLEREVALTAPTGGDGSTTASLAAQPSGAAVTAAPTPRQPIYKKWWLWTLVGVAVAGAITATVIATYPREPRIPDNAQTYSPMF